MQAGRQASRQAGRHARARAHTHTHTHAHTHRTQRVIEAKDSATDSVFPMSPEISVRGEGTVFRDRQRDTAQSPLLHAEARDN